MAGFSDEKRAYVRRRLVETGRELFARYGLKKTTVADLTEPAGIADGTFYRFFESKERLYLEVLAREQAAFGERVDDLLAGVEEPTEGIAAYLRFATEEIETNPLVQRLFTEDDWERLVEEFPDAGLEWGRERELDYLCPHVCAWQDAGRLPNGDTETLAWTIDAAALVALHRDDVGERRYPAVRDTLIESVAAGLVERAERLDAAPGEPSVTAGESGEE